jgi:hypothetical protein
MDNVIGFFTAPYVGYGGTIYCRIRWLIVPAELPQEEPDLARRKGSWNDDNRRLPPPIPRRLIPNEVRNGKFRQELSPRFPVRANHDKG